VRITPVTGDLPAVATPPPPPVRHVAEPASAPVTAAVDSTAAAGADADAASGHRRSPTPKPCFDPPLIAQRAALGLPTGFLIAEFARSQGIPYTAASAAVDRELPERGGRPDS